MHDTLPKPNWSSWRFAQGGQPRRRRRAGRRDGCAHRPLGPGQVHGARCHHREGGLVGQQQGRCRRSSSMLLLADFLAHAKVARAVRAGPVRRRRSRASPATRASSSNMPGTRSSSATCCAGPKAGELAGFQPEFTVVNLPSFKADPKRHGVRVGDGHRLQFRQASGADRRHLLCRRDQEIGLHLSQLRSCPRRA